MRLLPCLSILLGLSWLLAAQADAGAPSAARLKAAFVYKFTLLVTWPNHAFDAPDAPLSVCILGDDPFDGELEMALLGRESRGRSLVVRRLEGPRQAPGCHVLFLAPQGAGRLEETLASVADAPTLTIGESQEFAERGGVIQLQKLAKRISFDINRAAARRAGLQISSKLLQVARAVHD